MSSLSADRFEQIADVTEQADEPDLKSGAFQRVGSTPIVSTMKTSISSEFVRNNGFSGEDTVVLVFRGCFSEV